MAEAKKLTVLLADDHKMFRQGIKQFILELDLVDKVVEAANGKEAVAILSQDKRIDLVILDLHMPYISGSEVCRYIKTNNIKVKVIILSMLVNAQNSNQLIQQGVDYCLPKDVGIEELGEAIFEVASGKKQELGVNQIHLKESLSSREIEVLKLMSEGLCSKQIAYKLNIGVRAVDTRRENIYRKLESKNSSEAIQKALIYLLI